MKVKPGDAVHIYAGTVHAIGAGILLAEVQQNSDVTYRLYDYGRRDADGQPRALHLDKALDVATLGPADTTPPGAELLEKSETHEWHRMVRTRGFEAQQLCFEGAVQLPVTAQSFCAVLCLDERGLTARLGSWQRALHKGECLFVPAQQAALRLQGRGRVLLVMLAL